LITSPDVLARRGVWPYIVFTGLVWGSGGLLSKGLVDSGIDAFTVTAAPFLVGAAVAWTIAIRDGDVRVGAVVGAVLLGAVNSSLPALMFNLAYQTLPAGIVTLILSTGPVFTAVAAHHAFDDERFSRSKGLGLALSLAGVAALVLAPGIVEGKSYGGAMFAFAGAIIAGVTGIYARRLAVRHGAKALVAPQLTAAGVMPVVMGVVLGRDLLPALGVGVSRAMVIVLIGTVASYAGFRSVLRANETGTTGQVSVIGYLIPLVGVVGGVLFFDEVLTGGVFVGAALIVSGVVVTGRASRKVARIVRAAG
jgi:drug/metabolite transporter (DMT)-like permease